MKLNPGIDLSQFFKVTTRERSDLVTPVCLVMLSLFGVFFIYSAQYANNGHQWMNQIGYLAIGAMIYCGTALIDYRLWLKYAHFPYLATLGMLVLVLIPGIGTTHGMGARRWIDLGPVAFQPSEFAKIAVLFATASILTGSRLGTVRDSFQTLIKLTLAVGIPMLLIIFEPDLGSALAIAPMVFAMLFVSNLSLRFFAGALGAFVLLIGVVALDVWRYSSYVEANNLSYTRDTGKYEKLSWLPLKDYQRNRVLAFAMPDKIDPMGIGWNSRQSLISVGSGGLTGKGWTEGTQAKLGYLPKSVAHNDFIFSVIAEERGFLGSITVVTLFGVVLWNGIRIAGLARDRFGQLLAIGVSVLTGVHVFVNIAMTIGLVPVKGIPLPFISYGGTFVLSCCLLQGLVQSVYRFPEGFLNETPSSALSTVLPEFPAHSMPAPGYPPTTQKGTSPNMNDQNNHPGSPSQDAASNYEQELTNPPPPRNSEQLPPDKLKADAKERSTDRPILQKILNIFRKEKGTYRELVINSEPLEKRVALLVDGVLERFEIERESDDRMVGGIYKGRIKNLDPGLKAAFVDIGYNKNAFLHYWDMLPAAADSSVEVVRVNKKKDSGPRKQEPTVKDIPGMYPPGSEIVIQVTKGPIGTKGPRTTTNLSIPGRYLILTPYSDGCGISRKIEDPQERKRLKTLINELTIPEGMGVIVRTAGEGKKSRYFVRDLHLLLKKWEIVVQKMETERAPANLYMEPDIVERTVRDFLTEDIDRVLIDSEDDFKRTQEFVSLISSRSRGKIAYYKDSIPVFERYNIERQIEQTFQRKVTLPSGGQIVIDETEALIAIDVNTGSHKSRSGDEKNTIFQVNMEAADEMARQIRLRNIGGLVIMDFIDMKERRHRQSVYDRMIELMSEDKAKTHILPISQLGIMQMTRQRQQESLSANLYTGCPYCHGRGTVKSATTMSVELQRRLSSVARRLNTRKDGKEYSLRVHVHPSILERLRSEDSDLLVRMEKIHGIKLAFRADPNYHVENFKIINANTNEEYR